MKKTVRCLAENKISVIDKWGKRGYYVKRIDKSLEYGRLYLLIQFVKEDE